MSIQHRQFRSHFKGMDHQAGVYRGDVYKALDVMEEKSVHAAVFSPPYFQQRDYGFKEQIGMEKTHFKYAEAIANVFMRLSRVVRDDGTVWMNVGDCVRSGESLGVPWLVASTVTLTGWKLVADIIWHIPNKMAETADGRPSRNHEYVFLFAKDRDYYYDRYGYTEVANYQVPGDGRELRRQARSVWTINNQSSKVPHYAAFPVELPERCIRLATSEGGCCPECGKQFDRVVELDRIPTRPGKDNKYVNDLGVREGSKVIGNKDTRRHVTFFETIGWHPSCNCGVKKSIPCTVLDPFGGIHRTGVACDRLKRNYIGIEYRGEYTMHFPAELARDREAREKKKAKDETTRRLSLNRDV